jgi:hypothetical protein
MKEFRSQNPEFSIRKSQHHRMVIIIFATVIFFLSLTTAIHADPNFLLGANFLTGFPQGEFEENIEDNGYGFGVEAGYILKTVPICIGGELDFLEYGSFEYTEKIHTQTADFKVDVDTTNSIINGYFLVRLQPKYKIFRPYVEGVIGLRYLETATSIRDDDDWEDGYIDTTNFDDTTFSYGGGGGFMIRVYQETEKESDNTPWELLLDFRFRYLRGDEAEYLKKGSIRRIDERLYYDVYESETDLTTLQIGMAVIL